MSSDATVAPSTGADRRIRARRSSRLVRAGDAATTEHNEIEMIIPVVREAIAQSGIAAATTSASRCSGSPATTCRAGRSRSCRASTPSARGRRCKESHVEMDAAWALYEAWVAIQTGEVDSALVYGFGKSSPGDLHEIMTLQTDPYYVAPLWPSMVDMAALQARAYLDASGRTERDLAEVAARSRRNGAGEPVRGRRRATSTADDLLAQPGHAPTRCATPTSRRSPTAPPRS